jgi:hypothetical protein
MNETIPLYALCFTVRYVENGTVKSYRCNVELPLKAARNLWDILEDSESIQLSQVRP